VVYAASHRAVARFDRFQTVFSRVDGRKARHGGVFRLSPLAINGRKRIENGAKTVASLVVAGRIPQRSGQNIDEGFLGHR
jgi:hypothetical protein